MTQFRNKRLRNRRLLSWNSNYPRADEQPDLRFGELRGFDLTEDCQGRRRVTHAVMKRRAHFAGFAVLIALGAAPVCGAASASVSGLVRDSAGVPQIGAEVQLLRPDLSVVASVYTNGQGRFVISLGASGPLCAEGDGHVVFCPRCAKMSACAPAPSSTLP